MAHPTASAPRDISTRSNLARFCVTLRTLDGHLAEMIESHWKGQETPAPTTGVKEGVPTHPELLDEMEMLLSCISNRVGFINARL